MLWNATSKYSMGGPFKICCGKPLQNTCAGVLSSVPFLEGREAFDVVTSLPGVWLCFLLLRQAMWRCLCISALDTRLSTYYLPALLYASSRCRLEDQFFLVFLLLLMRLKESGELEHLYLRMLWLPSRACISLTFFCVYCSFIPHPQSVVLVLSVRHLDS